jgi:hypothetical protein
VTRSVILGPLRATGLWLAAVWTLAAFAVALSAVTGTSPDKPLSTTSVTGFAEVLPALFAAIMRHNASPSNQH